MFFSVYEMWFITFTRGLIHKAKILKYLPVNFMEIVVIS